MTAVGDAFRAWSDRVEADPAAADALRDQALADLVEQRIIHADISAAVTAATATRDTAKAASDTAESALAAYTGETFQFTANLIAGSSDATGSFSSNLAADDGWITGTGIAVGALVDDITADTMRLSKPATATGTVAVTVQTGSLARADARLADLDAQVLVLQAELEDIADGDAILDTITNGRAALEAAGHYLAPRTIARVASGVPLSSVASQTAALNTWLASIPNGAIFVTKTAHLWRNVTYRSDGIVAWSAKSWVRLDFHGSKFQPVAVGARGRVHLRLTDCDVVELVRPSVVGSMPAGVPAYDDTYALQHGIHVIGGSLITITRPEIDGVYGSGIRASDNAGAKVDVLIVQGGSAVGRCGDHVLWLSHVDDFEWKQVSMGASARSTVLLDPPTGVVCDQVNLHNFQMTGDITEDRPSIDAVAGGQVTGFTLRAVESLAAHGPLTGDFACTAAGVKSTNLIIQSCVGAGSLLNPVRAAFTVDKWTGITFKSNTQAMLAYRTAPVMYGLKGTNVDGTIGVSGNTLSTALNEALIDGITYPLPATPLSITAPTSLPAFPEDVDITDVTFTATGGTTPYSWGWSATTLPPGMTFTDSGDNGVLSTGAGGPPTPGIYPVRFSVGDAGGNEAHVDLNVVVTAVAALSITAPTATSMQFYRNADFADIVFTASGGTTPYTWTKTGTLPAGMAFADVGNTGVLSSPAGPTALETKSVTFKVTDDVGAIDTITISLDVDNPAPPSSVHGIVGLGRGPQATDAEVREQGAAAARGSDKLKVWRFGIDWPAVAPTGGVPTAIAGKIQAYDVFVETGALGHIQPNYVPGPEQRTFTITGCTTSAGNKVNLPANFQTQLDNQAIAAGGGILGGGNWPGITAHSGAGITISGNPTIASQGDGFFTLTGGVTAGQSGSVVFGGTNAQRDQRIQPRDPRHYGLFVGKLVELMNAGHRRAMSTEVGINEWNQGLGSRPFVDPPNQFKMMCHAYVQAKLADPQIICYSGGTATGETRPNITRPNVLSTSDFYAAMVANANGNAYTPANYFANLLSAAGLTKPVGPKLPWDVTAIHVYGVDPLGANAPSFDEIARTFNLVNAGSGGGGTIPISATEQGAHWFVPGREWDVTLPIGLARDLPASPTNPRGSYLWTAAFIDLFSGRIRWPHLAFNGYPNLSSTTATLAERQTAAASVFGPFIKQFLREGAGDPGVGMYEGAPDPNAVAGSALQVAGRKKFGTEALDAAHTTIATAASSVPATITVGSTANFPSAGYLIIDRKIDCKYTGKSATTFTGCSCPALRNRNGALTAGMSVLPANTEVDALVWA